MGRVPVYRERLWPPVRWWLIGALGVAVVTVFLWAALSTLVVAVVGVALLLTLGAALAAYAAEVVVDADGLRAGRATLPWWALGEVSPLDRAQAAQLRGPGADPRSYLLLRGYVPVAVRVDVDDQADPTPYWYVSTRRPAQLAAALSGRGRLRSG